VGSSQFAVASSTALTPGAGCRIGYYHRSGRLSSDLAERLLMPAGSDWSGAEIALIVEAGFDLAEDGGRNKAAVRERLAPQLDGRSAGSIEFKLENVSHAMQLVGLSGIPGYRGRPNIQRALIPAVLEEADRRGIQVDDVVELETTARDLEGGSRITDHQRTMLASEFAQKFTDGHSIREIAEESGRSFGFVHGVLKEASVEFSGRTGRSTGRVSGREQFDMGPAVYTTEARTVLVRKIEFHLVSVYEESLSADAVIKSIRSDTLRADLYIQQGAEYDLLEAKSSVRHSYIREALGQLLDYAHGFDHPVTRLTALFPARPTEADAKLLAYYGVDVLYRDSVNGIFVRFAADPTRRRIWLRDAHKSHHV
jgi:hypothetical protein